MKLMQIKFLVSKDIYGYLRNKIGFDHVDEYLTSLIEKDRDEQRL